MALLSLKYELCRCPRWKIAFKSAFIDYFQLSTATRSFEVTSSYASFSGKSPDSRRISTYPCPRPPDVDAVFEAAMQQVRQRARGAIAPVACVQAVHAAATLPYTRGMERERDLFKVLFTSGQARALQYSFFAQRAVDRWSTPSGARWDTSKPRPVHRAAVIGKSFRLLICSELSISTSTVTHQVICVASSNFMLPMETKPSFRVHQSLMNELPLSCRED